MCPDCGSLDLIAEAYDFGTCRETGYADAGARFRCRDCGAGGDAADVLARALPLRIGAGRERGAGEMRKSEAA
jgi:hypothetical protein